jgi:hypothetical protein
MFLLCNLRDVERHETSVVVSKKNKLPAAATRLRVNATIAMAPRKK